MELVRYLLHKRMNQNKFPAQIGLVFTTLAWGATFVLVKNALNDAPPFIFAFYRFLIATIAILPFILINKDKSSGYISKAVS